MAIPRAAVFIDHGYLHQILKSDFCNAKVNYLVFSDELCQDLGCERTVTKLYDGAPYLPPCPTAIERKHYNDRMRFLGALRKYPRFEVHLGHRSLSSRGWNLEAEAEGRGHFDGLGHRLHGHG